MDPVMFRDEVQGSPGQCLINMALRFSPSSAALREANSANTARLVLLASGRSALQSELHTHRTRFPHRFLSQTAD